MNNRYWFGELTPSNAEEVAEILRDFLGERPYITVTRREEGNEWGDVRPYQKMKEVTVFVLEGTPSSIHIYDTYGSYGIGCHKTGQDASFISLEGNVCKVSLVSGAGYRVYWSFTHERKRDTV